MGWFFAGMWTTLCITLGIKSYLDSNMVGMLLSSGLLIVTAFFMGMFIVEESYK